MPSVEHRGGTGLATATGLTGLNATTGVTVAFWVRPRSYAGDIVAQLQTGNAARDGYLVALASSGLTFRIADSAGATDTTIGYATMPVLLGVWQHLAVTFDDSTNFVRVYRNGALAATASNTRDMTDNASCTTWACGNQVYGALVGSVFDLQVLPDVVVPAQDIPLLMNPKYTYHGLKARYFGVGFRTIAASGTPVDESGNGHDLTVGAFIIAQQGAEPPITPTFA
jgi:hypothetical protein